MNREQQEEAAALAAVGALEGEDLAAWERLTAGDPAAARLQAEFDDALAAWVADGADATAPEALRGKVMDAVFGQTPVTVESSRSTWGAWAAAAAIAILAVVGSAAITGQTETIVVRDARPDQRDLHIALTGYGDFASATAHVLWDSGQRGWYIQAAGLPALPETHRYRVWAVSADGELYDCGELPLRPGGFARRFVQPGDDLDSMQGFAVTVEPAGTSPTAPSTPAVLISPALRG